MTLYYYGEQSECLPFQIPLDDLCKIPISNFYQEDSINSNIVGNVIIRERVSRELSGLEYVSKIDSEQRKTTPNQENIRARFISNHL